MSQQERSGVSFERLPFLEEYLGRVLRPRVEALLSRIAGSLEAAVWDELLRQLVAGQGDGERMSPADLRRILEERLELRIRVTLERDLGGPGRTGDNGKDGAQKADQRIVEQVEVRRRMGPAGRPLVDAMRRAGAPE